MSQPGFRQIQFNLSGLGCWLTLLGFLWLLGAVGLGWIVKSLAVIVVLILLIPVFAFVGARFWLKRNLIQADCPVCTTPLTGLKDAATQCPNCGTLLTTTAKGFQRPAEEGTIDITAVDVVDITADTLTLDVPPTLPEGQQD
ncbi:hypothetical protein GFS31_05380 [Leptolyngbya sp. BL0902]|uniref:hypothetical protein n=1 Tax=Leptolyngbya sp. BL0902 TaxID=1115757 RepID=UPI0018E725CE|nr:hypothetical protein [Leptolyngbya sp. BL0902]QQE63867.1 hypothetical protein GFS31_05380 [Leptolyngbya sp. BL0902]